LNLWFVQLVASIRDNLSSSDAEIHDSIVKACTKCTTFWCSN